ncbi:hypothetical protein ACH5RR_023551 [Cinchona calisaya]|uniref:Retrotransposon gag domain-containing protein n=1 Tax=Cinchona calisaya TaxID=153742 RepID=A0ABD2ZC34_9GENT
MPPLAKTVAIELDLNESITAAKEHPYIPLDNEFFHKMDWFDEFIKESQGMENYKGKLINDPRVAIRLFGASLERNALKWFLKLDFKRLRRWADLTNAFVKQHESNRDLVS